MLEAQSEYEAGLIAAAAAPGPAPGMRHGLPAETLNPAYTNVTYKKWDGENFVAATQWMKLGMTGMSASDMSAIMTRQATKGQVNAVHAKVMGAIQKKSVAAAKAGEDPLKAAALAAKAQYAASVTVGGTKLKVSTILGSLPRQYQVVLDERGL